MRETRLLVLGAGPAQLTLLAAARRRGLAVVAADRNPSAPGFRYAQRRALISVEDEPALDRLARAEHVEGVIAPGSDRSLAVAARVAQRLAVFHPLDPEAAQIAASHQRLRQALAAAGIEQPHAVLCHSPAQAHAAAARLGFPCVVAAVDRQDEGRAVARDKDELPGAIATALAESGSESCLLESVPEGPMLAVAGFVLDGCLRALLVADDDPAGLTWPSSAGSARAAAVVEGAARAAAALGVRVGPFTARVVLTGRGACVVAAAPRLGGAHEPELCRAALGVDLNGLALCAALGETIREADLESQPRVGGACVRFLPPAPPEAEVANSAEIAGAPGVRGLRLYRSRARGGALLASGGDADAAREAAEAALRLARLETADAAAVA